MRFEEDAFGKVELPEGALYGIQTLRSVENMSFSGRKLNAYPEYISSLADVKKAAARANERAGILPRSVSQAIEQACEEVEQGCHNEHFIVDPYHGGGCIGSNMNMNEVVANLANELLGGEWGEYNPVHPNDHVNASQSTSDACHTALRISIVRVSAALEAELELLANALESKSRAFAGVRTITRTCLQDGMQDSLGTLFAGYEHGIRRRLRGLSQATLALTAVNLGGTVIGSGVGAAPAYREQIIGALNEVTGLSLIHRENLYDASMNMDDVAAVSSELQLLSGLLIKLAKDFRLLSSGPEAGFGELKLPAVQAGSSFFPGKINPVVPETLIQCCFQVIGLDRSVQASLEHGELNLNVWEGLAGFNVLDSLNMLRRAVSLFTDKCVKGTEANEERCEKLSRCFIPVVVELKEKYGYSQVSRWLKNESKDEIRKRYESEAD
ncbi:aspartate ammonia-lyase [Cohnella endophytica]|uniref:Aspartate ammonia-lyase n=1 Tax=Cohnella endophytica TaxID=2419778 RepID=A0A494XDN1_9BACL|nr:lyase family protein [Cohnella endophytica]RKP48750.1 aspartate ammonia-lyase [Cohnella endophytica]